MEFCVLPNSKFQISYEELPVDRSFVKFPFWELSDFYSLEQMLRDVGNAVSSDRITWGKISPHLKIFTTVIGKNIYDNYYKIDGVDLCIRDIYDISRGCYLDHHTRMMMMPLFQNLKHVPYLDTIYLRDYPTEISLNQYFSNKTSSVNPDVLSAGFVLKSKIFPEFAVKLDIGMDENGKSKEIC